MHPDGGQRHVVRGHQDAHREREQAGGRLGDVEDPALVGAVDDDAAERAEQQHRQERQGDVIPRSTAEACRTSTTEEALRERLEPRARDRDELPDEVQAEVADLQRDERLVRDAAQEPHSLLREPLEDAEGAARSRRGPPSLSRAEPLLEERGLARRGCRERASPAGGERDALAAAVRVVDAALDEPVALERVDQPRHRGRPHLLGGGELAERRRAEALDHRERGGLPRRDPAERARPQAPVEPRDGGAQSRREVGDGRGALGGRS